MRYLIIAILLWLTFLAGCATTGHPAVDSTWTSIILDAVVLFPWESMPW